MNTRLSSIVLPIILAVFIGGLIPENYAAPKERVDINIDKIVRPVTYAGSGFLEGAFSMDEPDDDLLLPLNVQRVRGREVYIETVYKKCKALDISMEVIGTGTPFWKKLKFNGSEEHYKIIEQHFESLVKRMLKRKLKGLDYSIFIDADSPWLNWTQKTDHLFLEAYRRAYKVVKRTDPHAKIVGPGCHWAPITSWWKEHKGDHTRFLRLFIDYCIENDCVPDIISWHDYSMDGLGITRDAKAVRAYLKKKGLPELPFEQDDLGAKNSVFRPGIFASYLANVERARITYTIKCCWNNDCRGCTLQGMLTKEDGKPRSLWWMYKAYGDFTGNIVEVTESKTVDAVAAIDKEAKIIRTVVGRFKDTSGPVLIRFNGLSKRSRSVKVVAERIKNTEARALEKPEQTISKTMPVKNGVLDVILDDLGPFDAYTITLTIR